MHHKPRPGQLPALVGLAVLLAPTLAAACSVCAAASEETKEAYIAMTLFMTITPLATLGTFVWWIRKHYREPELTEES